MKKVALSLLAFGGGLLAILVGRSLSVDPVEPITPQPAPEGFAPRIVEHLSGAVKIATVSHEDPADDDPRAFERLGSYLEQSFPLVHQRLELTRFDGGSRLYRWKGERADAPPLLLLAHMDVVPVEPGTEGQWTHKPYSGDIAEGFIWGRGVMDDKLGVVGNLEAAESLLAEGWKPGRDIYFAFGHDEEVGGDSGAGKMAEHLREKGVRPLMILDEGGAVVEGSLPGITEPVALIGIAEKGYTTVRLSVQLEGGHSSMPAPEGSISVLSEALIAVQSNPLAARLEAAPRAMLETIAPASDFATRLVATNLWLLEPVLLAAMGAQPAPASTIRTTTALTIVDGGTKDNVLPARAEATVNFRTLPGDTDQTIVEHLRTVIDDERVAIEVTQNRAASPTSDAQSASFEALRKIVGETFELRLVAPYLVVGGTDARHYTDLSDQVYRFLPIHFGGEEDRKRLHGTDERIAVEDATRAVWFYRRVLEHFGGS
jgi:carboxypeptidase PM20D1